MSLYTQKGLEAVVAKIKADAGVTALVSSRVYSSVPQVPTFPYLVVRTVSAPYDGKGLIGSEIVVRISVHSEYDGAKEVGDIVTALHSALHEESLSVSGATFVNLRYDGGGDALREPDGVRWQGAVDFRLVITN